jgi:hypothetical protein
LGIGGGFLYVPADLSAAFPRTCRHRHLTVCFGPHFPYRQRHSLVAGLFDHGFRQAIGLSIGAIIGAQIAVRVSRHIHGDRIIRSLPMGLATVVLRLVILALQISASRVNTRIALTLPRPVLRNTFPLSD